MKKLYFLILLASIIGRARALADVETIYDEQGLKYEVHTYEGGTAKVIGFELPDAVLGLGTGEEIVVPETVEYLGTAYPVTAIDAYTFENEGNFSPSVKRLYLPSSLNSCKLDDGIFANGTDKHGITETALPNLEDIYIGRQLAHGLTEGTIGASSTYKFYFPSGNVTFHVSCDVMFALQNQPYDLYSPATQLYSDEVLDKHNIVSYYNDFPDKVVCDGRVTTGTRFLVTTPITDEGGAKVGTIDVTYTVTDIEARTAAIVQPRGEYPFDPEEMFGGDAAPRMSTVEALHNPTGEAGHLSLPEKVTAPDGTELTVTVVGPNTGFGFTEQIQSIEFPATIVALGDFAAFEPTDSKETQLRRLTFAEGSNLKDIGNHALRSLDKLEVLNIPTTVETIGSYAFGQSKLPGFQLGDYKKLTSIGDGAFNGNIYDTDTGLQGDQVVPPLVTEIPANMVNSSYLLTSITLPEGITSIGSQAFENCQNLGPTFTIPASCTTIGIDILRTTPKITDVWVMTKDAENFTWQKDVYELDLNSASTKECTVHVSYDVFKSAINRTCCEQLDYWYSQKKVLVPWFDEYLYVDGKEVTYDSKDDIFGDGEERGSARYPNPSASFDFDTHTLTLNGTEHAGGIETDYQDLNIYVKDITSFGAPIKGDGGTLTIGGYDYTTLSYLPCNLSVDGDGEAAISGFDDVVLTDGYIYINPSFTEPDGATYTNGQLSLTQTTIGIPTSTGLTIGDVEVFKSNAADILGDGTASLDLATWTLTLNGLHQSSNQNIMHVGMTVATPHALTINLVGENDLFGPTNGMRIEGTDVTITSADGSGVLNSTSYEQGVVTQQTNLVIENCLVNVKAGTQVLVNNTRYNDSSTGQYVTASSTLTVTDATLILGPNPAQSSGGGIGGGGIEIGGGEMMMGGEAMMGFEELILNRTKIKTPKGGFFVPDSQDRGQYDWCWANVLCQTTNDDGDTEYVGASQVVIAPHSPSDLMLMFPYNGPVVVVNEAVPYEKAYSENRPEFTGGRLLSNAYDDITYTWTSSNPSVATVDDDGTVHIVALGETTITASFDGDEDWLPASASYVIEVVAPEIDVVDSEQNIYFDYNLTTYDNETGEQVQLDLSNTTVDEVYYCIDNQSDEDNPSGFFDIENQCLVLNETTSEEQMQQVLQAEMSSPQMTDNFNGLIILLQAGTGVITVNTTNLGSSLLAIRIGDGEPTLKQQSERGDVEVEYSVNKDTYLYIYAADGSSQSSRRRTPTAAANCVKLYSITITPTGYLLPVSEATYATYYNSTAVQLPAGVKAAVVTDATNGTLTLDYRYDGDHAETSIIPGGTAVLIASAQGSYMLSFLYDDSSVAPSDNLLRGSDESEWTWGGDLYYKLTYSADYSSFGFFWGAEDGGEFVNPAHKAYLALSSSLAKGWKGFTFEDTETGIESVPDVESNVPNDGLLYNLSGQRIGSGYKGIVIRNGKKVLVK